MHNKFHSRIEKSFISQYCEIPLLSIYLQLNTLKLRSTTNTSRKRFLCHIEQ